MSVLGVGVGPAPLPEVRRGRKAAGHWASGQAMRRRGLPGTDGCTAESVTPMRVQAERAFHTVSRPASCFRPRARSGWP